MNKLFTQNLPWKITSLVLAFIVWLFVINTQNPTQPQEVSGIKVEIKGLEELEGLGYELTNRDEILSQNFKVVVSGPRLETDKLVTDPKRIVATLDLTEYAKNLTQDTIQDTANYTIHINLDSYAVSLKDRKPQVTKIIIDKIDSKEQKIIADISEEITDKYTLLGDGKPVITPEKIRITGAKSDIDRVSEAKVFITTEDFSEDKLVNNLSIHLFDVDGEEIKGLQLSTSYAEVKLPIGSQKVVPIKANFTGEVPEGYVLMNTIVSPAEVTIVGKAEVLANINKIELVAIDKSTLTQTDLRQVDMILPEGVMTLIDNKVSVSLEVIQESTFPYTIPTNEMNLTVKGVGEHLTYEILTPSIEIILRALPNTLLLYNEADVKEIVKATLDLTGYKEGEYTLPLALVPPEDTRIINGPININIRIKRLEQDIPTSSPEDENQEVDGTESSPSQDTNSDNTQ